MISGTDVGNRVHQPATDYFPMTANPEAFFVLLKYETFDTSSDVNCFLQVFDIRT